MNTIEKSGALDFRDIGRPTKGGFYAAELFFEGRYVDTKTFWPADWLDEQIMESILEAYDHFAQSGATPVLRKGKLYIKAPLTKGVDIGIWITKKGKIVTAYPVLQKGI